MNDIFNSREKANPTAPSTIHHYRHPDDASDIILEALQKRLKETI